MPEPTRRLLGSHLGGARFSRRFMPLPPADKHCEADQTSEPGRPLVKLAAGVVALERLDQELARRTPRPPTEQTAANLRTWMLEQLSQVETAARALRKELHRSNYQPVADP